MLVCLLETVLHISFVEKGKVFVKEGLSRGSHMREKKGAHRQWLG